MKSKNSYGMNINEISAWRDGEDGAPDISLSLSPIGIKESEI